MEALEIDQIRDILRTHPHNWTAQEGMAMWKLIPALIEENEVLQKQIDELRRESEERPDCGYSR